MLPPAIDAGRRSPGGIHVVAAVRGVSRLAVEAVIGATDIVEDMHRNVVRIPLLMQPAPRGRTRGITGLVYRSIRRITGFTGSGIDAAISAVEPVVRQSSLRSPRQENLVAVLNGVLGDHLEASDNPLAIPMHLRHRGVPLVLQRQALADQTAPARDRLLLYVHGLCMNDLCWQQPDCDDGAVSGGDSRYSALHLRYNTGRSISANGHDLAMLLERLIEVWPSSVRELAIVGHSMGGLVARSAHYHAATSGHRWPNLLDKLVFVGTPHFGAPLERAGHRFQQALGLSPYTAALSRLGQIRSAGIMDLRHGRIAPDAASGTVSLKDSVRCFAIAATRATEEAVGGRRLPGDGLVPVESALGIHRDGTRSLSIPNSHQRIIYGLDHLGLLGNPEVREQIDRWLSEG